MNHLPSANDPASHIGARFALRICPALDAPRHAASWATHAITVIDPARSGSARSKPEPLAPLHLVLCFDDIEKPAPGRVSPSLEHLETVLTFSERLTACDRLLIHCVAGISRSTALAIAVLVQHGEAAETAVARVAALRPEMWPNDWLIRHADDVLGTGGTIRQAVRHWLHREAERLEASGEDFA